MSLLVQEDLIALGNKITQFHDRILCTIVALSSTEQQSCVSLLKSSHAKIYKDRKIEVCHVKGRINSFKKQGARLNDVKDTTIAIHLQEFDGHFLSVVSGQLWCGPSCSNVGSVKDSALTQH